MSQFGWNYTCCKIPLKSSEVQKDYKLDGIHISKCSITGRSIDYPNTTKKIYDTTDLIPPLLVYAPLLQGWS